MQFSTILSAFLATLAVSSPVNVAKPDTTPTALEQFDNFNIPIPVNPIPRPTEEASSLEARAPAGGSSTGNTVEKTTKFYDFVKGSFHGTLEDNQYYAFTMTWDKGTLGEEGKSKALDEARANLGFDHKAVVTGKVTKTSSKVGKKTIETWNFVEGKIFDIGLDAKGEKMEQDPVKTFKENAKDGKERHLHDGKKTTQAKVNALQAAGKTYIDAHEKYDPKTNNCATYADELYQKHL